MGDVKRLTKLLDNGSTCISIVTHEERESLEIVRLTALELNRSMLIWSIGAGVRGGILVGQPVEPDTESVLSGLYALGQQDENSLCVTLDLADHLANETNRRALRELIDKYDRNGGTMIMIDSEDKLPSVIKSYAKSFELSLPSEKELDKIVRNTIRTFHRKKPVEVGITCKGMEAIIKNLKGLTRRQVRVLITEAVAEDRRFDDADINRVMAGKRRMMKADSLLEFIQTPLDLDEIGGMNNLKKWLHLRKKAFSTQAADFGINPPRGILLLGVQGAGKSLCAKAIATAWRQPLLRLDVGCLYNSYIGQSEANLRTALRQAEFMSPVILWIDEIEKGFASAASRSSDGGLSQRMFGSLLTWMQEHEQAVFLVATANDIGALPPELLRKGRFDEIFFVDLPGSIARQKILEIHVRKRKRNPSDFDLKELASICHGYSGAEIEQAIVSSLHLAFDNETEMTTEMIAAAIKSSPPLSATMALQVQQLCEWAKGRCVPAD